MSHPSPLSLERFSVGDLSPALLESTKAHVDGCEACTRALAQLATARDARMAEVPPAQFLAQLKSRPAPVVRLSERRGARLVAGATAVIALAAALLLVVRRPGDGDPRRGGLGLKGTGVTVQRSRGGDVHALADGETLRGGDALRVVVTQSRALPVAVWFVDRNGRVDAFLRDAPLALPAGESVLPGSARVESPCLDLALVVLPGTSLTPADAERAMKLRLRDGATFASDSWIPDGAIVRRLACE